MPHETIGRYALYGPISAGGMAAVHYGRRLGPIGFSRVVAIKRLHAGIANDPEHAAMFLDEARLSARIHHPNVVATIDVVEAETEVLLVMDYVAGPSLSGLSRMAEEQFEPLPQAHAVAIVLGALHGLHAAHEAKSATGEPLAIVHRDVSPQNILVGDDGIARLIDFGIAKASEQLHATRGFEIRGKILYMPPEQLARKPVDRRADVYSASVVLWELLAGRRFIDLGDVDDPIAAIEIMRAHRPGPPSERAPSVRPALDAIVMRGLSQEPELRYQTALEMATALEAALTPSSQREVGEWVSRIAGDVLRERAAMVHEIENDVALATSTPARRFDARPWVFATAVIVVVLVGIGFVYRRPPPVVVESVVEAPVIASFPAPPPLPSPAPSPSIAVELPPDPVVPTVSSAKPRHPSKPKSNGCNPPYTMDHGIKVPKPECT